MTAPGVAPHLSVSVNAHMGDATGMWAKVHAADDRVVLVLEGDRLTDVRLFADRPDLERLRDTVSAALADLDVQRTEYLAAQAVRRVQPGQVEG